MVRIKRKKEGEEEKVNEEEKGKRNEHLRKEEKGNKIKMDGDGGGK